MIKIGTVNGDVIEAGGVKNVTNNYYGKREEQPTKDLTLDAERLAKALKECKPFIWGNAAYSIPFCVCRDLYHMTNNASLFERMLAEAGIEIPDGTINAAMSRNPWMKLHIEKWEQQGAMERVLKLRDKFIQEMEKE